MATLRTKSGFGHSLPMHTKGILDGMIVCSNCIADLGIEEVEWMRNGIKEHKNDVM